MGASENADGEGTQPFLLVKDAIHNPADPRHFMRIKPMKKRVIISRGGKTLAETTEALLLLEVGRDLYNPAIYIPRSDISSALKPSQKTSHCPLKGDASYFDLTNTSGATEVENVAWCYPLPFGFADELKGYVSFYTNQVTVTEIPN